MNLLSVHFRQQPPDNPQAVFSCLYEVNFMKLAQGFFKLNRGFV